MIPWRPSTVHGYACPSACDEIVVPVVEWRDRHTQHRVRRQEIAEPGHALILLVCVTCHEVYVVDEVRA